MIPATLALSHARTALAKEWDFKQNGTEGGGKGQEAEGRHPKEKQAADMGGQRH